MWGRAHLLPPFSTLPAAAAGPASCSHLGAPCRWRRPPCPPWSRSACPRESLRRSVVPVRVPVPVLGGARAGSERRGTRSTALTRSPQPGLLPALLPDPPRAPPLGARAAVERPGKGGAVIRAAPELRTRPRRAPPLSHSLRDQALIPAWVANAVMARPGLGGPPGCGKQEHAERTAG
jgi:hypothetical protein